jgi:hypothetical protein
MATEKSAAVRWPSRIGFQFVTALLDAVRVPCPFQEVFMKRYLGFALAMFFAIVAIALVGGDSGAIAGHGCHGGRKCHGGLLAKHKAKKAARRCHGQQEAPACESACGCEAAPAEGCSSCGGEAVMSEGCSSCGGEAVSGGCAGGDCGGAGVISEGVPTEVPTEAAPAAPVVAEPAKT